MPTSDLFFWIFTLRASWIVAPAAIGPYSQAVKAGDLVFVSGCIGFDPKSMLIVEGGIQAEVDQALKNLKNVVEASGSEVGKIVKTTVRRIDMVIIRSHGQYTGFS